MHNRTGTRTTRTPMAVILRINTKAYCPLCGWPLHPAAVMFVANHAFCASCGRSTINGNLGAMIECIRILSDPELSATDTSLASGLRFWTPRDPWDQGGSLLQRQPADTPVDYDPHQPDYPNHREPALDALDADS